MPVWRNARMRRLYGKPDDPIEAPPPLGSSFGSRSRHLGRGENKSGIKSADDANSPSSATPLPPPKRVKREKTRPESEYELIHNFPVTATAPDYALLTKPASAEEANMIAYAIHMSRQNWLAGAMFETFWTRKPRGKKLAEGQVNLREKMTKLHECSVTLGPHTFPVKLFTVRDDNAHVDEEADRKIEEQLTKEKEAKEKKEKEEREKEEQLRLKELEKKEGDAVENKDKESNDQNGSSSTVNQDASKDSSTSGVSQPDNSTEKDSVPVREPGTETSLPGSSEEGKQDNNQQSESQAQVKSDKPVESIKTDAEASTESKENASANNQEANQVEPAETEKPEESKDSKDVDNGDSEASGSKSSSAPKKGKKEVKEVKKASASSKTLATEKENLELEKRRNEELEQKLKGSTTQNPPNEEAATNVAGKDQGVESSAVSTGTLPATTQTAGVNGPANGPANANPETSQQGPPLQSPSNLPAPPPPQQQPEMPKTTPNQLVVYRLQQMAARDPALSELMKHVASGTAPPDSIAKFQEVINRVKASIFAQPPPPPQPKRAPSAKKAAAAHHRGSSTAVSHPKPAHRVPVTHLRANSKAIMLAIEFEESPTDRYLFPKRSIIEYIPQKNELLWSFLHVTEPQSRNEKAQYTPFTAVFHDIPLRIAQTLERCVRKPEVVAVYMKQAMAKAQRAQPWNIWFQIEKNDEVLLDMIRKTPAPVMAPPPPPRKPTKPRKPRGPTAAQLRDQQEREKAAWLEKLKRGQPLETWRWIQPVRGQPLIQEPDASRVVYLRRATAPINPRIQGAALVPPFGPAFPQQSQNLGNSEISRSSDPASSIAPEANNLKVEAPQSEDLEKNNMTASREPPQTEAGVSEANDETGNDSHMEVDG